MRDMNVSLQMFGLYQGLLSLVFSVTSLYSFKMIEYFGTKKCFYFGLWLSWIAILSMVILGVLDLNDPLLVTISLAAASCGVVFPITILYPMSLAISGNAKGRMASITQALRLFMTAVGLQIISYYYVGTFFRVAIILGIILGLGLYGAWRMDRKKYINWSITNA